MKKTIALILILCTLTTLLSGCFWIPFMGGPGPGGPGGPGFFGGPGGPGGPPPKKMFP